MGGSIPILANSLARMYVAGYRDSGEGDGDDLASRLTR
jgi:hypothetical protein